MTMTSPGTVGPGFNESVSTGGPAFAGPVGFIYTAGQIYTPPAQRGTLTRPNGFGMAVPLRIEQQHTFVAIAVEVTSAGSAGAVIRLGVYAQDPVSGQPGALLVDAGTIDATVIGVRTAAINLPLPAGWVFLASAPQGAPTTGPTCRTIGANNLVPGMPVYSGSGFQSGAAWVNAGVGGALPNPFGATGTTDTTFVVGLTA